MHTMDKNIIMTGDLIHNSVTDGNGFIRLKRESFVLIQDSSPITLNCIIDNRVIDSDNMGATIEFIMQFNFIKNSDDKRTNCIELKTPADKNDLTISVNLLNWRAGIPLIGVESPVLVTNLTPLFNISTAGQIFFRLTARGCIGIDAVFVDVDFWYGDPDEEKSTTTETTEKKEDSVKS